MAIRTHLGKQDEGEEERALEMRAADPGSPIFLETWLNTTEKRIKYYDGASTQTIQAQISNLSVVTKVASYIVQASDDIILVDASGGDVTLTLPPILSNEGKTYTVAKIDSSAFKVIIDPDSSELINGESSIDLVDKDQVLQFLSNDSSWMVVSNLHEKYRKHVLSAAHTTNSTVSDLTFNNLEVGKSYEVSGSFSFKSDGSSGAEFELTAYNGAAVLATLPYSSDLGAVSTSVSSFKATFKATATTVTFETTGMAAGHSVEGTLATSKTHVQLEEKLMAQSTTQWD